MKQARSNLSLLRQQQVAGRQQQLLLASSAPTVKRAAVMGATPRARFGDGGASLGGRSRGRFSEESADLSVAAHPAHVAATEAPRSRALSTSFSAPTDAPMLAA